MARRAPMVGVVCGVFLVIGAVVSVTAVPTAEAVLVANPRSSSVSSSWDIIAGAPTDPRASHMLLGATCATAGDCWAVGIALDNLDNQSSKPTLLIEHGNGAAWSVVPVAPPSGDQISALWDVTCVGAADCWAVGADKAADQPSPVALIEHWNGSAWSAVPVASPNSMLFSVTCVGAADCWAAGTTLTDDPGSDPLSGFIEHWNGAVWTRSTTAPSGQAHDQFNSVACAAASDCWAVGYAGPNVLTNNFLPNVLPQVAGDQALAEHWNGATWSVTPVPAAPAPSGTYLAQVTCPSATGCWAVGATMGGDGQPVSTLADRWNGSDWSEVHTPDPSASGQELTDISCLDASECWASGALSWSGGKSQGTEPAPLVEMWNGVAWSVDPTPEVTAYGYLNGVTCTWAGGCLAVGFAFTDPSDNPDIQPLLEQMTFPGSGHQGLLLSGADGGVYAFGDAGFHGSLGGLALNAPVVGMAATPDGAGYWLVGSDGGVYAFGDASFHGSMGAVPMDHPVVGLAATPDGGGYWLVGADGGVYSFGDAPYDGSVPGLGVNPPAAVDAVVASPDGGGYWLVGRDGAVFSFGDAGFLGSLVGMDLAAPVVGAATGA